MKDSTFPPTPDQSVAHHSDLLAIGPQPPSQETTNLVSTEPHEEPSFTYTMSQALETLERISLDLPVTDDANYFPPTINNPHEIKLLEELRDAKRALAAAKSHQRYLERQVLYAQIEAGCVRTNALIAHSTYSSGLRGLVHTLTLGLF